jgi:hypothetical protein
VKKSNTLGKDTFHSHFINYYRPKTSRINKLILLRRHSFIRSQGTCQSVSQVRSGQPATGLNDRGSIPGSGRNYFVLATTSKPILRPTQSLIEWVPGALSLGVKRSEREADHSPPSSAKVKNTWSVTFAPPHVSWRGSS